MHMDLKEFYSNKRVLVTGSTGFKGTWLCEILKFLGANVTGYALAPATNPAIYDILGTGDDISQVYADIRDFDALYALFDKVKPEIVFHLAAQPIVRRSYKEPRYTYETNVMGTVNICECIRRSDMVRSFVNVTTDKVYQNEEYGTAFTEDMPLNGRDPYSNSKSCSELVTESYRRSFFDDMGISVSTVRAGNVIGGGDFSDDRIIPDCVRASHNGEKIIIRNPHSIRPFQHVLEPLYAYLVIAKEQWEDKTVQGCYNIGSDETGCITTGELADRFCAAWGQNASWVDRYDGGPYEAGFLMLDCHKLNARFKSLKRISIDETVKLTVDWYKKYYSLYDKYYDNEITADSSNPDNPDNRLKGEMLLYTYRQMMYVYGWD